MVTCTTVSVRRRTRHTSFFIIPSSPQQQFFIYTDTDIIKIFIIRTIISDIVMGNIELHIGAAPLPS